MKKILGLDIGTNSIGWALINHNWEEQTGNIVGLGSRIIPMEGREKDFEAGNTVSKAADRRQARSARRMLQRYRLRRERLITTLKILGWMSESFPQDFKSLDKFNINDCLPFSPETIAEARKVFNSASIPNDWLVYYLRTKALKEKITFQEFARVIYHFNQRRGFKSSRKDKSSKETGSEEVKYPIREKSVEMLTVRKIEETDEKSKYGKVFSITAFSASEATYQGSFVRKDKPDWETKQVELEITKITNKAGEVRYEFRMPDRTDWEKMKLSLERDIEQSGLYTGEYHFRNLLQDRNYRIKERIIDRSFYQKEFDAIWEKQSEFYPELKYNEKIPAITDALYKHNNEKRNELLANDLRHLIRNDIIYYQRGLKSQKHLISDCPYEKKQGMDGKEHGVKVAPKSSPVFQEFRIWQDIQNIRIIRKEQVQPDKKMKFDIDESSLFLTPQSMERLFNLFDRRSGISANDIFKELSASGHSLSEETHRLNFPAGKEFKGNETKAFFRKVFRKFNYVSEGEGILNDRDKFQLLWHVFYSLQKEEDIQSALKRNFGFPDDLARHVSGQPEFSSEYAAYSSKAIKKLLALMRCGSLWNLKDIDGCTRERIENIIAGEVNEEISPEIRLKIAAWEKENRKLNSAEAFYGLPLWLASYAVYGRHSERGNGIKYESHNEISPIEPNSLRNPIVEQVVNETLLVIKDIWKQYGRPDEIHIELARDLKKNAEERKKITEQVFRNEMERKRVTAILRELGGANPESPSDMNRLLLWEETGNRTARESFPKFSKEPNPTEIEKYILWGEQNHISPYTGKVIPLSRLFTPEYEIEHIIPRSRFFDNSMANKTICEAAVNSFKDNSTAMEMINEHGGREIEYRGKKFRLLNAEEYAQHIKTTFYGKWKKVNYFLREEIPGDFVSRQINDTRYISKKLGELLYPIASDGVIYTVGSITSELKEQWGLHRVWKELLRPRFERLEKLTGQRLIELDKERNDIYFKKDFKRIDHRHHALDALIIAATGREHIRYLNSLNAASQKNMAEVKYRLVKGSVRNFVLPWVTFTKEAREALSSVIVSHKNRTRVLTKGFNRSTRWVLENGEWRKKMVVQEKGPLLSVRKSMFKEPFGKVFLAEYRSLKPAKAVEVQFRYLTQYSSKLQARVADKELRGRINALIKNCAFDLQAVRKYIKDNPVKDIEGRELPEITILEFNPYAAKRVGLDKTFDIKKIDKIPYANHPDNLLVKSLREHLQNNGNNPAEAFSGEGLDNLAKLYGKPISKVTICETIGSKYDLNGKLVEADKGSNAYFVIYENIDDPSDRIIDSESSLPLLKVIECLANGQPMAEDKPGYRKIILSPNDLVYVPEPDENISHIDWDDKKKICERIYKVVSFTKFQCQFLPHSTASLLQQYDAKTKLGEFGSLNKSEKSLDGQTITKVCIKVNADRLGNIKPE